jgi:hypothetical protein
MINLKAMKTIVFFAWLITLPSLSLAQADTITKRRI